MYLTVCVRTCVCVCACVRACVRACMRARSHVCLYAFAFVVSIRVCLCVSVSLLLLRTSSLFRSLPLTLSRSFWMCTYTPTCVCVYDIAHRINQPRRDVISRRRRWRHIWNRRSG